MVGIAALIGWASWALLMVGIGGRLLPVASTRVDVNQLLRTLGFSAAPGLLAAAGVFPHMAIPAFLVTAVWMCTSMVVAVRHALDYESTWRALGVCVIGWMLAVGIVVLAGSAYTIVR